MFWKYSEERVENTSANAAILGSINGGPLQYVSLRSGSWSEPSRCPGRERKRRHPRQRRTRLASLANFLQEPDLRLQYVGRWNILIWDHSSKVKVAGGWWILHVKGFQTDAIGLRKPQCFLCFFPTQKVLHVEFRCSKSLHNAMLHCISDFKLNQSVFCLAWDFFNLKNYS